MVSAKHVLDLEPCYVLGRRGQGLETLNKTADRRPRKQVSVAGPEHSEHNALCVRIGQIGSASTIVTRVSDHPAGHLKLNWEPTPSGG